MHLEMFSPSALVRLAASQNVTFIEYIVNMYFILVH